MKQNKKRRNDIILISALLSAALLALAVFRFCVPSGNSVMISVDGKSTEIISLNKDSERVIKTENGTNIVEVKNGKVSVVDATCPDKLCQKHRPISKVGESIVCLPNKVTLRIFSQTSSQELDVVV